MSEDSVIEHVVSLPAVSAMASEVTAKEMSFEVEKLPSPRPPISKASIALFSKLDDTLVKKRAF